MQKEHPAEGGVRYLAQGNVALVREALRERGLLLENAPHLVKKQAFIIPCFSWFSRIKYLIRILFLDAHVALQLAPLVAPILAKELGKDKEWEKNQLNEFADLVKHYLIEYFI